MATVKITDSLLREIDGNVRSKYSRRIQDLDQKIKTAAERLSWRNFWSEPELIHVNAIKEKMACVGTLHLSIEHEGHTVSCDISFEHDKGPLPAALANSHYYRIKVSAGNPCFTDFMVEALPYLKERKEVFKEIDDFTAQVKTTLSNFATVNQAIKSWPALEGLLPQATLSRVREKVTRTKAEEVTVDQQALNTTLLKLNIMS